MMKIIISFLILASCAQIPKDKPSWVDGIRLGNETLKVSHGSKTFYRRIAGSPATSKQTSCNLVIMKAEEDLKKEYPIDEKIPYVVEVLYYDEEFQDCAVTISISNQLLDRSVASHPIKELTIEDEASRIVLSRSERASIFALTGLEKSEFEKFSNEKVQILNEKNMCSDVFHTNLYSIHGLTHLCWKGEVIAGYCNVKDRQCWTRTP